MKPTLFIDDLEGVVAQASAWTERAAIRRILPRRCPGVSQSGYICGHGETAEVNLCVGLGFFYPDPPDWWEPQTWPGFSGIDVPWEAFCQHAWMAMGILDD